LSAKFLRISLPFAVILLVMLVLSIVCMEILSAARAYVGGEGLWSKAQKDAVTHLTRYARTQTPTITGVFAMRSPFRWVIAPRASPCRRSNSTGALPSKVDPRRQSSRRRQSDDLALSHVRRAGAHEPRDRGVEDRRREDPAIG